MDFESVVQNITSASFDDIEKNSQECQKNILYDLLDKKGQYKNDKNNYFTKCQILLGEYRKRLKTEKFSAYLNDVEF